MFCALPFIKYLICFQVRNAEARRGGLDASLFMRLSIARPEAVVMLTHQYRMNNDIMLLSNTLVYGGQLKSGSPQVGSRRLILPNFDELATFHPNGNCPTGCWLRDVLDPRYVLTLEPLNHRIIK